MAQGHVFSEMAKFSDVYAFRLKRRPKTPSGGYTNFVDALSPVFE